MSLNLIGEPIICDLSSKLFVNLLFSYTLETTIDFGDNKLFKLNLNQSFTPSLMQFQNVLTNPGIYIVSFSIESYSFLIESRAFEVFRKFSFCFVLKFSWMSFFLIDIFKERFYQSKTYEFCPDYVYNFDTYYDSLLMTSDSCALFCKTYQFAGTNNK